MKIKIAADGKIRQAAISVSGNAVYKATAHQKTGLFAQIGTHHCFQQLIAVDLADEAACVVVRVMYVGSSERIYPTIWLMGL